MTLRRALTGGLFGLVLAAATVSTASAAPADYPPGGSASIGVSATTVTVGASVSVSGGGWAPNSTVNVTTSVSAQGFAGSTGSADSALGAFRPLVSASSAVRGFRLVGVPTNASGSFSTSVTLNQVGTVTITASGLDAAGDPASASATVLVVGAGGGVGGPGGGSGGGAGSGSGGGSGVGGAGDDGSGSGSGVGGLPNTGASIGVPVALGAILVLGGAGLITAVRRRRRADIAA